MKQTEKGIIDQAKAIRKQESAEAEAIRSAAADEVAIVRQLRGNLVLKQARFETLAA